MLIHTVGPGENLYAISRRYGVSIDDTQRANLLPNPGQLIIGQSIVIPITAQSHTVRPGDTLFTLSQRYGVTPEALAQANNIPVTAPLIPGTVLRIPQRERTPIEVNAYLEIMGERGRQITRDVGFFLTYMSFFSYQVRANGDLVPINDQTVINEALNQRVAPLMVITNFAEGTFSSEIARAVFTDQTAQNRLFDNIESTLRTKGYRGLNIDFEYIFPEDRELYNQFLRRVVARFRPQGYLLCTAVAPKTSGTQTGTLYEAHDYPVHGQLMDFVILMTYEWGWSGGPPLAVAPVPQVRQVLDYATTVIPANKIMMGMPLYGYDWVLPYVPGGQWARSISPQEAIRLALRYNAAIQYDPRSQAPFFNYYDEQGREHIVWFEDARSAQAKFDLVKAYNLRGVSYWVLGGDFPQNWILLADNFTIRKIV
ncbi:glycosyl hydrolase family 18 protein [Heliobacterium mobile]|uniref:glycosyl hydrolase family 18 protein n=1 Tax=Heliobacterium mobile TaxID=28064 RepID=UPI0014792021|nr:glycosyl hydrolase family 18 protein [Heliobacterium mobile]